MERSKKPIKPIKIIMFKRPGRYSGHQLFLEDGTELRNVVSIGGFPASRAVPGQHQLTRSKMGSIEITFQPATLETVAEEPKPAGDGWHQIAQELAQALKESSKHERSARRYCKAIEALRLFNDASRIGGR